MNKKIRVFTLGLGLLCLSSSAAAGFFDDLKNKVNEKIDQTKEQLKQSVDDATDFGRDDSNSAESDISSSNSEETSNSNNTFSDNMKSKAKAMLSRTAIRDPANTGVASDIDIIGLRLGMTVQEVKAALLGYDANLQLGEKYSQLPRLKDSKYLHMISATSRSGEQVMLEFAAPPHASTVVKIMRQARYREGAQPMLSRTLQALKQKYGEPSLDKNDNAVTRQLVWLHDRKGNKMATLSAELEQRCTTALIAGQLLSQQQNEALADCGDALTILLETGVNASAGRRGIESNGLVGGITSGLINVAELIRAGQETRKHIETTINKQAESVAVPRF